MIEEVKTTITVIKYKTADGVVYDKKEDAQLHEDLKSGLARTCPNCYGQRIVDPYGDGRVSCSCSYCNGKGYQYKITEWR